METILEQQRRLHEERERLTDAMRKESLCTKSTVSDLFCQTIQFLIFSYCPNNFNERV